ncbi:hypothetical protein A3D14_00245 [Candidatus Saccharibacteria bacterium RIFCSPHIGHO2_02_FULL_47_12]|nr:MAG: hypothetical protein A3D14_00245 [Candidatus Saccharibacteria bacterium RIFCSPHIGHO2_02_FULL_47_12]
MNISKEAVLYGIIGLLTGSLITIIVATTAVNRHNNGMMEMMGMHTDGNNHSMMQNMDGMDNSNMKMEGM